MTGRGVHRGGRVDQTIKVTELPSDLSGVRVNICQTQHENTDRPGASLLHPP